MIRLLTTLLLLPGLAGAFEIEPWPLPDEGHAALPNLSRAADGQVWLSWVERPQGNHHRLRAAPHDVATGWGEPVTVAAGKDWFVNWADFPAVAALPDGSLWAHWLRKLSAAPYAYEVRLARSGDGGRTWSGASTVHDDGTETEHGFVSLLPWSDNALLVAWLDGRQTGGQTDHSQHGGGAMTLRGAVFAAAADGKQREWLLDGRTCDCCQTAAAMTSRGPVLVYRGRDEDEVRDIKLTRFDGQGWTDPRPVHDDRWVMPACPVNGPAVAALGERLWVAWYTVANGVPSVKLAFSPDAGDRFSAVSIAAVGNHVLGRVALAADPRAVWLAWLSESSASQQLWLARLPGDLSGAPEIQQVASISGRGRGTGFPALTVQDHRLLIAWTEVVGGRPTLRGAKVAAVARGTAQANVNR